MHLRVKTSLAALALVGCAAKYHTVHGGQGGLAGNAGTNVGSEDGQGKVPENLPPAAGLEIVIGDSVVSQVKVGQTFILRPTAATMDGDDVSQQGCPNPGIVSAAYTVDDDSALTVGRTGPDDCGSLAKSDSLSKPGTYTVTLVVKTGENETAKAEATLVVQAADASDLGSPTAAGFVVQANPLVVHPGESVDITGDCAGGEVRWDFGDGISGEDSPVQHSFAATGAYLIQGMCTRPGQTPLAGSATVTVVPASAGTSGAGADEEKAGDPLPPQDQGDNSGIAGDDGSSSTSSPADTSAGKDKDGSTGPQQTPQQTPFQGKNEGVI